MLYSNENANELKGLQTEEKIPKLEFSQDTRINTHAHTHALLI